MPQSSDGMRDMMELLFGDRISDQGPRDYLQGLGYVLNPNWTWTLPEPNHYVDVKEELALRFLSEEWDFGGIESPEV